MRARIALLVTILFGATPVVAQSLRIGVPADPSSIDPHFQDLGPNANIGKHIFEALVATGRASELLPGLATSWRLTSDPTMW